MAKCGYVKKGLGRGKKEALVETRAETKTNCL
jgi:hypothetical protein